MPLQQTVAKVINENIYEHYRMKKSTKQQEESYLLLHLIDHNVKPHC